MPYADRNGVRFFYTEAGAGDPPLLFVHGWCCDSSHWRRQLPAFRRKHHVVAVDLRGHGRSDKPQQDYTMDAFAEDLEWLIGELELQRPVVIGHSMGGVIALRLAGRRKRALSGVVIVDSPIFPKFDRPGRQQLYAFFRALDGPMFRAAARQVIEENLFIPASPPELRKRITEGMLKTRQHVVSSAFRHMWGDNMALAKRVNVPSLFVDADRDLEELKRIQRAVKGIKIGRTVGAGHFNMLETPDQFNAMLRTFLDQLGSGRA
jgi:pimeloyl-ACP methyl ester carboxylesterase